MGFKMLKQFFNLDELLILATSLFYSKMYYAAEVWLSKTLTVKLQTKLMSLSAKILKTISGIRCDQTDGVSFYDLHKRLNRATPTMMTPYIQATSLHRIISNGIPECIYLDLLTHHVDSRRHYKPAFMKTNITRVGENIFRNRIQFTTNRLSYDITKMSYNQLKINAKKDFLSFN